jgi:YVTN family beta-propeller protein
MKKEGGMRTIIILLAVASIALCGGLPLTYAAELVKKVSVGKRATSIEFAPNGKRSYVNNFDDNTVSVLETASGKVIATVSVREGSKRPFSATDKRVYVPNSGKGISAIDTESLKVSTTLATSYKPGQVAAPINGTIDHILVPIKSEDRVDRINLPYRKRFQTIEVESPRAVTINLTSERKDTYIVSKDKVKVFKVGYEVGATTPPAQISIQQKLLASSGDRIQFTTKHEGKVWYFKHRGFWAREEGEVKAPNERFFLTYKHNNSTITRLLREAGYRGRRSRNDKELWEQIGRVWNFLRENVRAANEEELRPPDRWPSLSEYAYFYKKYGELAWHACFSKAHLFACILGRMEHPNRVVIASAHHTEGGAPPTATHVFVAVYVANEWFYIDPTAVFFQEFPPFAQRRSLGVASMESVDYVHPYKILILPDSTHSRVPLLSGVGHGSL